MHYKMSVKKTGPNLFCNIRTWAKGPWNVMKICETFLTRHYKGTVVFNGNYPRKSMIAFRPKELINAVVEI